MYLHQIIILLCVVKLSRCNKFLLPTNVVPKHYDLKILTNMRKNGQNDFLYNATSKIEIICVENTNRITMHSQNLNIHQGGLAVQNMNSNTTIKVLKYDSVPEYDFLNIYLETPLEKQKKYIVHIEFDGVIKPVLQGFYRSSYKNKNSKSPTWLATTQFEPIYARLAFPCWDEPIYKAKFKISISHHKELQSISNMPKEKTLSLNGSFVMDVFQETVPMSTYLVAYIISDFEFIRSPAGLSKTEFKIWARKSALPQAKFASVTGPKALSFFEKTFDVPFPLPKQDMVAVPDFAAGAMENWGLITYREGSFLFDSKVGTQKNKNNIASIICHELAHQWFGNLVTMKWWNDIWLNEGFATYMATICVDDLFPKWKNGQRQYIEHLRVIFSKDRLQSSLPLSVKVESKNDIVEVCASSTTYQKGSLVIRMMERALGTHVSRAGITRYLKKHAYSNAEQDNLWEALTNTISSSRTSSLSINVKEIMDTWTLQPGYPIVDVIRDYKTGVIRFSQRRFEYSSTGKNMCWWIPLSYTTADEQNFNDTLPKLWLSCPKAEQTILYNKPHNWIIFNIQQTGLYRVNYDSKNWNLILDHLKHKNIEDIVEMNRHALIDNIMSLAETNDLQYDFAFEFLTYLKKETKHFPWIVSLTHLTQIAELLKSSKDYTLMKRYMQSILKQKFRKDMLHKEKLSKLEKMFLEQACTYEVQDCVQGAVKIFQDHMKNPKKNIIRNEVQHPIYCTGLKFGGEKEWNFLFQKYLDSNVISEKNLILSALGCTKNHNILKKYLGFMFDEKSGIKKQDSKMVFGAVAQKKEGYKTAKEFFFKNMKEILKLHLPGGYRFGYYITVIANGITQDSELKEFKEFISQNSELEKYAKTGVKLALENAELHVNLFNKNCQQIINALRLHKNDWS